jgi:predicted NBD/HSP70 family sugar kinase
VVELVRAGSQPAMAVVRQAGRDIGEVVATMVNLINPSVVVIGGQVAGAGEHLLAGIRESVYQRSLPLATEHLRIVTSRAGGEAAVLGASALAIEHVLSPEVVEAASEALAAADAAAEAEAASQRSL